MKKGASPPPSEYRPGAVAGTREFLPVYQNLYWTPIW